MVLKINTNNNESQRETTFIDSKRSNVMIFLKKEATTASFNPKI